MIRITISETDMAALCNRHEGDPGGPISENLLRTMEDYGVTLDQLDTVYRKYDGDEEPEYDDEDYPVYEARFARLWSVAIYEIHQQYGGPEEGGWYYTAGNIFTEAPIMFFSTRQEAVDARNLINEWMDADSNWNASRRPLSSVLSDGRFHAMVYTNHPALSFPKRRPHYE